MATMSRREFMERAAIGSGVAGLLVASSAKLAANPLGLPIGSQVYPLRSMVEGKLTYDRLFDLLDPKLVKFQFQMSTITAGFLGASAYHCDEGCSPNTPPCQMSAAAICSASTAPRQAPAPSPAPAHGVLIAKHNQEMIEYSFPRF